MIVDVKTCGECKWLQLVSYQLSSDDFTDGNTVKLTRERKDVLAMAEYIEREAAYEDFEKCNSENPKWTPNRVKALIARQKAADVAPVVHGRWIASHDEFCACSICKYPVYVWWNQTNYCPNCGAKMDLEE